MWVTARETQPAIAFGSVTTASSTIPPLVGHGFRSMRCVPEMFRSRSRSSAFLRARPGDRARGRLHRVRFVLQRISPHSPDIVDAPRLCIALPTAPRPRDWQAAALSLDLVVKTLARRKRVLGATLCTGGLHARLALPDLRRAAWCGI